MTKMQDHFYGLADEISTLLKGYLRNKQVKA
jgi:hypothetical protein